jgi:hypothetical protein
LEIRRKCRNVDQARRRREGRREERIERSGSEIAGETREGGTSEGSIDVTFS